MGALDYLANERLDKSADSDGPSNLKLTLRDKMFLRQLKNCNGFEIFNTNVLRFI